MKKRALSALAAVGFAVTLLTGCGGGDGGGGGAMDTCIDEGVEFEGMDRDAARAICELMREIDRDLFYEEFGD
ncbi:MAG: hypothetical protein FWD83_06245 [Promicromonosporaceae bacterium]|nr:hypothetical protein [Promicromonosporaceae bacterium]